MNMPSLFDNIPDEPEEMTPPRSYLNVIPLARITAASRATDPETSRQAAASISKDKMRETQRQILEVLGRFGPSCDEDIAIHFRQLSEIEAWPLQSPSGLRSRRAELVNAGLVRDSGQRTKTSSGRQTIVWELVSGSL